MAHLLFIYSKTDKRNQWFQDFSQNSRIDRKHLQFVKVFFGHPLEDTKMIFTYLDVLPDTLAFHVFELLSSEMFMDLTSCARSTANAEASPE